MKLLPILSLVSFIAGGLLLDNTQVDRLLSVLIICCGVVSLGIYLLTPISRDR
jgi:hypothetical protein